MMDAKSTLIILPGWGGDHETWKEFIAIAANDFDVLCIDLPCFGDEPCPPAAWGVEEYANFVESKVKSQKSKVVLLGHSFGGQIAAFVAATHPETVEKLILSGPAIFRPKRTVRRIVFGAIAKIGKLLFRFPVIEKYDLEAKKLLHRAAGTHDYGNTAGIKREIFKKIIRQDMTEYLPSIKAPTLLLWGAKDTYVPVSDAWKAKKLIPDATVHIFEGAKHGLHLERPQELYEVIKSYVSSH